MSREYVLSRSIATSASETYQAQLLATCNDTQLQWQARRVLEAVGFVDRGRNTRTCDVWRREKPKWLKLVQSLDMDVQPLMGESAKATRAKSLDSTDASEFHWLDTSMLLLLLISYIDTRRSKSDKEQSEHLLHLMLSFGTSANIDAPETVPPEVKALCWREVNDDGYCKHLASWMSNARRHDDE
eukprot:2090567-Amphidinium_carterae.2